MSALTIVQGLTKNVGQSTPLAVFASSERDNQEMAQMLNDTGEEVSRRVDWGALRVDTTLTGDSTNQTFTLPSDFDRLSRGAAVLYGTTPLRPLSQAEWGTLTPTEEQPRYFLLEGNQITLWPYLGTGETVTVRYQSKNWASSGATFGADGDTALLDEDLLLKGLIARWRRAKGLQFQDFEAEYEAMLADQGNFDSRARI